MLWFTSDLHLGHRGVIRYARRPFRDVEEMDSALIAGWNDCVQDGDRVYLLGDVSFHGAGTTRAILAALKGSIVLVRGNHDRGLKGGLLDRFESVHDLHTVKAPDPECPDGVQRIVLCHYALRTWDKMHHGSWHLYGHSHGTLADLPTSKSFDVGVDACGYRPLSYDQVKERMARKWFAPVDHHGREEE